MRVEIGRGPNIQTISATLLATSLTYKLFTTCLRWWLRKKYTAIYDVDGLNSRPGQQETKKGTVIIAGGSIAGLYAARICADHFSNVIIVDPEVFRPTEKDSSKDDASNAGSKRSAVFQYSSVHAYQPFTLLTLRKLFPGFDQHLAAVGGFFASDPMYHSAGRRIPLPSGFKLEAMALSRDVYEPLLRRLVLSSRPNIKCIDGTVTTVQPATDKWERLASATITFRDGGATEIHNASLIIDCTGRAAHGYKWFKGTPIDTKAGDVTADCLPHSGLPISYDPRVTSQSWEFVVPENFLEIVGCPVDRSYLNLWVSMPDYKQDGRAVIFALYEHNRLLISFGGFDWHQKATSVADVRAFLLGMELYEQPPDWVYSILDNLEENDYPSYSRVYRVPPSTYIRYHRAAKLPCNFIALGDSILTLNPVAGQGCTKACIEAVSLNTALKSVRKVDAAGELVIPSDFSKKFFQVIRHRSGRIWDSNRASDYGYESSIPARGDDRSFGEGERTFISGTIIPMIMKDEKLAAKFWSIGGFLEAPAELMFPSSLFRILWNTMKDKVFF